MSREPPQIFELHKLEDKIKFENNTPFRCWISFKPIPPKRTYNRVCTIAPGHFVFLEQGIDLCSIAITFEEEI
jgi:hypothetical protein